jgi:hypothetical protein
VSGLIKDFVFNEFFLEYAFYLGNVSAKAFADWSKSEIYLEGNRWTGGIYASTYFQNGFSGTIDLEYQNIERAYLGNDLINNIFASVTAGKDGKISFSLIYEFSDDPNVADRASTDKIELFRHFPGAAIAYKPNNKFNISVFGGSRQGGPACAAGICYEVLDFEGVELRITSKF